MGGGWGGGAFEVYVVYPCLHPWVLSIGSCKHEHDIAVSCDSCKSVVRKISVKTLMLLPQSPKIQACIK